MGPWTEWDTSRGRQKDERQVEGGKGSDGGEVRERQSRIERNGGRDESMKREDGHGLV